MIQISKGDLVNSVKNIVIVGSNPSVKSPDLSAFHPSTKSRKFIDNIFKDTYLNLTYVNIIDVKLSGNKPISRSQIKSQLENIKLKFHGISNTKIITFGKSASYGLQLAEVPHFEMPHPSGLCRFWNDRSASEIKIKEMFAWIRSE
jgi:hypothetical protein